MRWTVGNREKSSTFKTNGLAESFLSKLRQAARDGEAMVKEAGPDMPTCTPGGRTLQASLARA
ncbi:hypothetical protein ACIBG8_09170 [Nonomuraea sp. NPDC050556]|uniref:hypothetical protein n=1 Tax=Nonomuraea sp. NPDC050556 TaxID=3364369 RepID=UPI00379B8FE1